MRRHRRSPAASPLDDDDLLTEILLRLPPQPSSLPRASAVCTRWRGLVSDPGFVRGFRLRHRRNPPMLGCFFSGDLHRRCYRISLMPTLEPPNRVGFDEHFSMYFDSGDRLLNCRHGLLLFAACFNQDIYVWNPTAKKVSMIPIPTLGFDMAHGHGAVRRAPSQDIHHLEVVLVGVDKQQPERAIARVYSSETHLWGDLVSTPLPSEMRTTASISTTFAGVPAVRPVLVGDCIYWLIVGISSRILEFDLDRQSLAVIPMPVELYGRKVCDFTVTRAEDGQLGLFIISDFGVQLWKRRICSGAPSWVLEKTIELNKLLPLISHKDSSPIQMVGYAEVNNVVFLLTVGGIFMVHLESLRVSKLPKTDIMSCYHPLESLYTAGI